MRYMRKGPFCVHSDHSTPLRLHKQSVSSFDRTHHSLWVLSTPHYSTVHFLIQRSSDPYPLTNLTMRSTTIFAGLVAFASTAFAADCAAQNIVDACVSGYQERIKGCQKNSNDWICLCDVYTDVLTCYNNCPDSNEKPPVQNQVTQYCTAAEP